MLRQVRCRRQAEDSQEAGQLWERVVNTEKVASIVETRTEFPGRWCRLRLRDGEVLVIEGCPEDFLGDLA
jgi:hypothetical protein